MWIKQDEIAKRIAAYSGNEVEWPLFSLLQHHPLLCGTFVYYINLRLLWLGIFSDSACDTIFSAAHLYNAANQSHLLSGIWPDMEHIISVQKAKNLFVGGLPTQEKDFYKRFQLALGAGVLNFSRNGRRKGPETAIRRKNNLSATSEDSTGRQFRALAPIHEIFKPRDSHTSIDLTDAKINMVLTEAVARCPDCRELRACAEQWAKTKN
jgi:hypothetical protein